MIQPPLLRQTKSPRTILTILQMKESLIFHQLRIEVFGCRDKLTFWGNCYKILKKALCRSVSMDLLKQNLLKISIFKFFINIVKTIVFVVLSTSIHILHSVESRIDLRIPIICPSLIIALVTVLISGFANAIFLYYCFVYLCIIFLLSILLLILYHNLKEPDALLVFKA